VGLTDGGGVRGRCQQIIVKSNYTCGMTVGEYGAVLQIPHHHLIAGVTEGKGLSASAKGTLQRGDCLNRFGGDDSVALALARVNRFRRENCWVWGGKKKKGLGSGGERFPYAKKLMQSQPLRKMLVKKKKATLF